MPQIVRVVLPKGTKIPDHIAIILDGNRRWARSRGLPPTEGHKAGYAAMKRVMQASRDLGVHTLTLWGFSTENWERPTDEISKIMNLIKMALGEIRQEAKKEKIRFVHLGRKDRLPVEIISLMKDLEEE